MTDFPLESNFVGVFGTRDMLALKRAFEATCERLNIAVQDEAARSRIAESLLRLANEGPRDFETLSTSIKR